LAFVGCAGRPRLKERAHQPRHLSCLDFIGRRRRRHILVQRARLRLRDVSIDQRLDDDALAPAQGSLDGECVAGMDLAMRLRGLIVDVDPSAPARLLRFGARSEQARDIQPDVETDGVHELIVEYGNHPFQECAACSSIR